MSNADKKELKRELRREMLQKRNALETGKVSGLGEKIAERIAGCEEFLKAEVIYLYAPARGEADIWSLLEKSLKTGKRVMLPRVLSSTEMAFFEITGEADLVRGYRNIREPGQRTSLHQPEKGEHALMLVPGTAFDKSGGRIGMGGGFYDRYLKSFEDCFDTAFFICGVCMEFQLLDEDTIPMEDWDKRMDFIATEQGIYLVNL